jgi:hypothetical protein
MLGSHFAKHLRGLQFILKSRFGMKATSESGENTIYIGPDKIDMTNAEGTIVARGPARVATVLVRRKRKRK